MLLHGSVAGCFLLLNNIPFCGSHCGKKILSSVNGYLGCSQFLALMNKTAMNIHKVFYGHIFSFLLVKSIRVELLDCMMSIVFNFI